MGIANAYCDFVRKNSSLVASIENSLKSLTYLLPGRFKDSLFISEVGKSSLIRSVFCNQFA